MGKIISFSGIDGAGKSTQVELLRGYFKKNNKKILVTESMFGYYTLRPIIKLLRSVTKSPKAGPVTRNKNPIYKLWFIFAFVDIWLGYLFDIRPMKKKYDYIVADRFYTDIWANLLYYGYSPKCAFKLFLSLLPKSDLSILLSVRPNNVLEREDDFEKEYYVEQSKIYKQLSRHIKCTIIDANLSPKGVFSHIISHVEKI